LHQTYHRLRKLFWMHRWYSRVTMLKWKLVLVHFETVFILVQDWCVVCAIHTIGSEIVLDTQDDTPR
jgi:hypothetical protein